MPLVRYLPPKPVELVACVKAGDRVCVRPRHEVATLPDNFGLFAHLAYCPFADYYSDKQAAPDMQAAPGVGTDIRLDMGSAVYLPYAGALYIVGGSGPEIAVQVNIVDPPRTVSPRDKAPPYVWWTDRRADRDWSLTWHSMNTAVAAVTLLVPNNAYAVEVMGAVGSAVTPLFGTTAGNVQNIPVSGDPLTVHLNSATNVRFGAGITYARFLLDL